MAPCFVKELMMDNRTAITVGRYTEFTAFDRADFDSKMRDGYSFDQYMIDEKNAGVRIAIGPYQSAKNKFQIYVYNVDGKEYYKSTSIPVSWDIRASRKGNPIGVRYNPMDPYDAVIDKSVNVSGYQVSDSYNDKTKQAAGEVPLLIALILSIMSILFGFLGVGGLLGIVAIIINAVCKKQTSYKKITLILSIVGICISVIIAILFVVFVGYSVFYY